MDACDLVSELDHYEPADVDHGAGQREPRQPGDGAFDDPADPAEAGLVLNPPPGDAGLATAPGQVAAVARARRTERGTWSRLCPGQWGCGRSARLPFRPHRHPASSAE